jgi:hypothetical protein
VSGTFDRQTIALHPAHFSKLATFGVHFQENLSGSGETFIGQCDIIGIPLEEEVQ